VAERVLITGGAGFIGSHTADALLRLGHEVRVLDSLGPQVHPSGKRPGYLASDVELMQGDVRNIEAVRAALDGVTYVYHMAAETGVGQSMYEAGRYMDTNARGLAVLWDAVAEKPGTIKKVILASSRAVYGEGAYVCPTHGAVYPTGRDPAHLRRRDWAMRCPLCDEVVDAAATPESCPQEPASIYGLTKKYQEEISRLMSKVHRVPVTALRYFNVYGRRQAPANPYTGVIVAFLDRLACGAPIALYEEGVPKRDFVHVSDVVQANLAALRMDGEPSFRAYNVGSGTALTLLEVARIMCSAFGRSEDIEITARHRVGDILGCYADLDRSRMELGYQPQVSFEDGIRDLTRWIGEVEVAGRADEAEAELRSKGLLLNG
jgi:dTDP-L-rhamnose 4-epimerase